MEWMKIIIPESYLSIAAVINELALSRSFSPAKL
jgi:hypothetical protein